MKFTSKICFCCFAITAMLICACTFAQDTSIDESQGEFIESYSPPPAGSGNFTSRSTSSSRFNTTPGLNNRSDSATSQFETSPFRNSAYSSDSRFRSTRSQAELRTAKRPATQATNDVYPYPATRQPIQSRLTPSQTAATNTQRTPTPTRTAFQSNAQGQRVAQACDCNTGQAIQYPVQYQQPAATAPSINYAPQTNYQIPATNQNCCPPPTGFGTPGFGTGAYAGNTLQFPPVGANAGYQPGGGIGSGFRNWFNPLITGRGAYQPIFKFQNLPPGTYLGQGVIGQPTAYVDGQPIRNLLRYVSP